ncbi:MAG TPA: condensation domain-containing protein, partial [Chthoniobacterales bacterium]
MKQPSQFNPAPDASALKQRLSALSATQRAQLAGRLSRGNSSASAAISRAQPLRIEAAPTPDNPARTLAIYPAGQGQLQMWFLQYYAPQSPVYNIPQAFRLLGPLNARHLEAAFRIVIQRHDSLRTTFAMEDGRLVQRVASSAAFHLELVDVEPLAIEQRNTGAHRAVEELASRAFDLVAEAQIRARLVRLHGEEHVLVVSVHHIISDGWSQSNLFREISESYRALVSGEEPALAALPLQFADFSVWEEQRLRDSALTDQIASWKAKLAGSTEPLDLATDRPRSGVSSFRGESFSFAIDPQLWSALQQLAQAEGVTLFMLLLSAFKVLLHRHTGQEDVRVGAPIANRPRVETESLIGFFVNTLVMRTAVSADLTFRELLARVKTTAIEAYANSDLSFERLVEMFTDTPSEDRAPLLQTLFSLQDFPETTVSLPGVTATPWPVNTHTSKMDFSVAIERDARGWAANVEYDSELFDAERLERMIGHWFVSLQSVVANPAQRVAEIPMLTAAERDRVLLEWNRTEREYPRDKCVHELF